MKEEKKVVTKKRRPFFLSFFLLFFFTQSNFFFFSFSTLASLEISSFFYLNPKTRSFFFVLSNWNKGRGSKMRGHNDEGGAAWRVYGIEGGWVGLYHPPTPPRHPFFLASIHFLFFFLLLFLLFTEFFFHSLYLSPRFSRFFFILEKMIQKVLSILRRRTRKKNEKRK